MDVIPRAVNICQEAEKSLRQLMQEAIGAGDYRDLPALARFAEQLAQMASRLAQNPQAIAAAVENLPSKSEGSSRRGRRSRRRGRHRQPVTPKPALRNIKAEYPKFRRDGDNLIKTGWSRSSRREYEHRAPKRVAAALLGAIAAIEGKKLMFTVEDLMPVADPTDRTEVPAYQVYLALAWLRKEGIVRQHGREGYSLMVKTGVENLLEERWDALSSQPA